MFISSRVLIGWMMRLVRVMSLVWFVVSMMVGMRLFSILMVFVV